MKIYLEMSAMWPSIVKYLNDLRIAIYRFCLKSQNIRHFESTTWFKSNSKTAGRRCLICHFLSYASALWIFIPFRDVIYSNNHAFYGMISLMFLVCFWWSINDKSLFSFFVLVLHSIWTSYDSWGLEQMPLLQVSCTCNGIYEGIFGDTGYSLDLNNL